jgi:hypothetical protein
LKLAELARPQRVAWREWNGAHRGRGRREAIAACRKRALAGFARGLDDDLRETVEETARPLQGLRLERDVDGYVLCASLSFRDNCR